MDNSWFNLLKSDPTAASSYGLGAPAPRPTGPQGLFSGLFKMPVNFSGNPDFFNNADNGFKNTYSALAGAYAPTFAGSNFQQWFTSGRGESAMQDAFAQLEALLNAQGSGYETPTYTDFFRKWDPTAAFRSLTPGQRGEDPAAYSPFTRFLTR